MPPIDDAADSGMDMDSASASIAAGLGFGTEEEPKNDPVEEGAEEREEPVQPEPKAAAAKEPVAKTDVPAVRQPPSSWAKETHELWAKISPEAQAQIEHREKQMLDGLGAYKADATYGKSLREAIAPYQGVIAQQGVSETHAIQFLLDAHSKLSTLAPEARRAFFTDIGKKYGMDFGGASAPAEGAAPVDPRVQTLEEKLESVTSTLAAREKQEFLQKREAVAKQVEAFWSDPAHPYADEVAEEIARLAGVGYSLEEAYEKAVWGNPVIREKELARVQTEAAAKLKENLKKDASVAKKAIGANVRSRDTSRAPTELLGTMDETLKSTLSDIRGRV